MAVREMFQPAHLECVDDVLALGLLAELAERHVLPSACGQRPEALPERRPRMESLGSSSSESRNRSPSLEARPPRRTGSRAGPRAGRRWSRDRPRGSRIRSTTFFSSRTLPGHLRATSATITSSSMGFGFVPFSRENCDHERLAPGRDVLDRSRSERAADGEDVEAEEEIVAERPARPPWRDPCSSPRARGRRRA
jgi:hypothetical protein